MLPDPKKYWDDPEYAKNFDRQYEELQLENQFVETGPDERNLMLQKHLPPAPSVGRFRRMIAAMRRWYGGSPPR